MDCSEAASVLLDPKEIEIASNGKLMNLHSRLVRVLKAERALADDARDVSSEGRDRMLEWVTKLLFGVIKERTSPENTWRVPKPQSRADRWSEATARHGGTVIGEFRI